MEKINMSFWQKNQVFITGLVMALILTLQQFLGKPEVIIDWKAVGMAAIIAIAGYVGNELRGKGVTVGGFIGVTAYSFYTIQATGHFTWSQFFLMCILGFLSLVAPPPKLETYEHSTPIQQAKAEAQVLQHNIDK